MDGVRVAIVGGGPSGSLCAYFLLRFAHRAGAPLEVDIYEPRDFSASGPPGCNMCGGVVSESLVARLAADGIDIPAHVLQRDIDAYVFHARNRTVRIATPHPDRRIAAVYRGAGPKDMPAGDWHGLDEYLLTCARQLGARLIPRRVREVRREAGRPQVRADGDWLAYDLLVGATGVNSGAWRMYEAVGVSPPRPRTTRAYITELYAGREAVARHFGSAMHVFLPDIPGLEFAAIIPKGDFLTVCLIGRGIDRAMVEAFFSCSSVRGCFPPGQNPHEGICHCAPLINVGSAPRPFADRVVLVGDCGATRLYKDGIGVAYRTARAAAHTAIFTGVSAAAFRRRYWPAYRAIARDNWYGQVMFFGARRITASTALLSGLFRAAADEQGDARSPRRLSGVLWDLFTGSAPYRDILARACDPRVVGALLWQAISGIAQSETEPAPAGAHPSAARK